MLRGRALVVEPKWSDPDYHSSEAGWERVQRYGDWSDSALPRGFVRRGQEIEL